MRKNQTPLTPNLISSFPQPTLPNQWVHADLFIPLKISANGKKVILSFTDAFTKYIQLVAVPNKETATVSSAIFNHWVCRFGAPVDLIMDQGKALCAGLSKDLF